MNKIIGFTLGALGALYIVTSLVFEFGIDYFKTEN